MKPLIDRKYLIVTWSSRTRRKLRHNKRVHSVYAQLGHLEVALWYR